MGPELAKMAAGGWRRNRKMSTAEISGGTIWPNLYVGINFLVLSTRLFNAVSSVRFKTCMEKGSGREEYYTEHGAEPNPRTPARTLSW